MEKLNLNSAIAAVAATKICGDERSDLIAKGKILLMEHIGRAKNKALAEAGRPENDFGSTFKSNAEFEAAKKKWSDDFLYFAAKKCNDFDGRETDRNERATFTNERLALNPMYLHTLSAMMNEIMYPQTPFLINELLGDTATIVPVPKGQTYTIEVASNAVIQWEDASWTSLRSVPQDRLYNKTITVNPKPMASRASINFYQMVGNSGNMVDTMAALMGGYSAKIMEKFTTAFTLAASNTRYIPSALKATGYTDQNWATVCRNVAASNRVRRTDLLAYGDYLALRKVLPDNATLASAIMMQLGGEYFRNGYLFSHDGVELYEVQPVVTPATINTTLTNIWPTDQIVIMARANSSYKPFVLGMETDGAANINLTPGDDVMATGRIEVMQVASAEIVPCFASRIGLIDSIT